MRSQLKWYAVFLCVMSHFTTNGFAQKYEVHPFAGGTFGAEWADAFSWKGHGTVGVKAGVFADKTTQVEGELGYIPHFEFEGTDPKTRALVWSVSASRNVFFAKSKTFVPFFSFGVGGVTARMDAPNSVTYLLSNNVTALKEGAPVPAFPNRTVTIENNDTFFMFTYGGGVKARELAGPLGLRANVLGRTLPNFFGRQNSWLELSGGVIVTWGKR